MAHPDEPMPESTTMTVRLDRTVKENLDKLAESTGRSRSFLAAEAIAAYVELHRWQVEGIKEALRKADQGGPFIPHDEVEAWANSLGAEHELPRPKGRLMR
jgi:predicted transcriptional regulator